MKQKEFDNLTLKEKGRVVLLEKGRFIGYRQYYNQKLVLYNMGDFFAEVWYEPDDSKILKIISLSEQDKQIDIYINQNRDTSNNE